jgi:hypothetical protein
MFDVGVKPVKLNVPDAPEQTVPPPFTLPGTARSLRTNT